MYNIILAWGTFHVHYNSWNNFVFPNILIASQKKLNFCLSELIYWIFKIQFSSQESLSLKFFPWVSMSLFKWGSARWNSDGLARYLFHSPAPPKKEWCSSFPNGCLATVIVGVNKFYHKLKSAFLCQKAIFIPLVTNVFCPPFSKGKKCFFPQDKPFKNL